MINQRKNNTLPINFSLPAKEVNEKLENIGTQTEEEVQQ